MQITNLWKFIKNLALDGIIESINFVAYSFVNIRMLVYWDNVWLKKSIFIYLINFSYDLKKKTFPYYVIVFIYFIYERFYKYLDTFLTLKYVLTQKKKVCINFWNIAK